jgi:CheY-like chemotaxis protein
MRGDITVRSTLGVGSEFEVAIAVAQAGDPVAAPAASPAPVPATASPPKPTAGAQLHGRILLAEDGLDNQRLLATVMRRAGAEVEVASNGAEALAKAQAAQRAGAPFDLIVMDVQMPIMDGYEATRQLREGGWRWPIVALTAHAMEGDRERCLAVGCDGYETKPVRAERLIATCRRFLPRE